MEKFSEHQPSAEQEYTKVIDLGLERHNVLTDKALAALDMLEDIAADDERTKYTTPPTFEPIIGNYNQNPLTSVQFNMAAGELVGAEIALLDPDRGPDKKYDVDITGWKQIDNPTKFLPHDGVLNKLSESYRLPSELLDAPAFDTSYLESVKQVVEKTAAQSLRSLTYQSVKIDINDINSINEINYRLQSIEMVDAPHALIIEVSTPYSTNNGSVLKTMQYVIAGEETGAARVVLSGNPEDIAVIESHVEGLPEDELSDYYHPDDMLATFNGALDAILGDKMPESYRKYLERTTARNR